MIVSSDEYKNPDVNLYIGLTEVVDSAANLDLYVGLTEVNAV